MYEMARLPPHSANCSEHRGSEKAARGAERFHGGQQQTSKIMRPHRSRQSHRARFNFRVSENGDEFMAS